MPASDPAGPGVHLSSLKVSTPQRIQPGSTYRIVRFPFGSAESTDPHGMHQAAQPDGRTVTDWASDDRSGLIWPSVRGWGQLYAMLQWAESTGATEYRDQFARDPLELAGPVDTTATEHRAPTIGGEYWVKVWGIVCNPGVPLAVRVTHNAPHPINLTFAEFKLVIQPLAE
ncbi:hypothetical protein [Streptomyces sp. CO7]